MLIIVVVCTILASAVSCLTPGENLAESHSKANVPDQATFDVLLKCDLEHYFKESKKQNVEVVYELLRKGPTQSGTSFPKFYVWVVLKAGGAVIEEGAVKVAAVEKKQFAVHDYVSKSDIEPVGRHLFDCGPCLVDPERNHRPELWRSLDEIDDGAVTTAFGFVAHVVRKERVPRITHLSEKLPGLAVWQRFLFL